MPLVTSPVHLCFLDPHWSVEALTGGVPACPSAGLQTPPPREGDQDPPTPRLSGLRPAILPCPSVPREGAGGGWLRGVTGAFIPTPFLFIKLPLRDPATSRITSFLVLV